MKPRSSYEDDLQNAEEIYRCGPRAKFWIGKKLPHRAAGMFSFSNRFVLICFLVLILLLILGAVAVQKTTCDVKEPVSVSILFERRTTA